MEYFLGPSVLPINIGVNDKNVASNKDTVGFYSVVHKKWYLDFFYVEVLFIENTS